MHDPMPAGFQIGLAVFYLLVAAMNFGFAHYYQGNTRLKQIWVGVGFLFVLHALVYFITAAAAPSKGPMIPEAIVNTTNGILNHIWGPILYFVGSTVAFAAILYWRKTLLAPVVAISAMDGFLLLFGWAM